MRIIIGLLLLAMLVGCSAQPVWETVEDYQPAEAVMQQDPRYEITIGVPEQMTLVEETADTSLYESEELEVLTTRFQSADLNAAVRHLSGFDADRLNILQTSRFDLPEYQFAWYSQSEEGGRLYRANLVMDGMTCYAVVCSAAEEKSDFSGQVRQVFASFGLFAPEPV